MSATTIIVVIVCLLGALVCYAFIQQTLRNRKEEHNRLINALKARSRTFKFIQSGIPSGFLTKELNILFHKGMVDVAEQLSRLEPKEKSYLEELHSVSELLKEIHRQPAHTSPLNLESGRQVKEVKVCLSELGKYLSRLESKGEISPVQSKVYRRQLQQLELQVAVDANIIFGKQARQAQKTKLAIHYFELAKSLIARESKTSELRQKNEEIQHNLQELMEILSQEEDSPNLSETALQEREELEAEWNKFDDRDSLWKKKNVYD